MVMKKVARIPRLSGVQQISAIKFLADQIRNEPKGCSAVVVCF
jgi:hypothetical protein